MDTVADFFNCCGKDIKEEEVSISVADRRRTHSEGNKKTARIKRSLGKRSVNATLNKNQNSITLFSVTGTSSLKHHHKQHRQGISIASIEVSSHYKELSLTGNNLSRKNNHLNKSQSQYLETQKEISLKDFKKIEQNQKKVYNIDNYTVQPQPPAIRGAPPRLLMEKRSKKKEQELRTLVKPNKETLRLTSSKRYPLVTSVLEPIQERLSLLSCSESQAIDLSGMKDRSMMHNVNDMIDKLPDISPITQKYGSCMFERQSFQTPILQSAKSQNMQSFQRKLASENEYLLQKKLTIDIELHQKELNSLEQQEKYLNDQCLFSKKAFKEKLVRLESLKKQLLLTLKQLENAKKTGILESQKGCGDRELFSREERVK